MNLRSKASPVREADFTANWELIIYLDHVGSSASRNTIDFHGLLEKSFNCLYVDDIRYLTGSTLTYFHNLLGRIFLFYM
jgi:hypothetical protein